MGAFGRGYGVEWGGCGRIDYEDVGVGDTGVMDEENASLGWRWVVDGRCWCVGERLG